MIGVFTEHEWAKKVAVMGHNFSPLFERMPHLGVDHESTESHKKFYLDFYPIYNLALTPRRNCNRVLFSIVNVVLIFYTENIKETALAVRILARYVRLFSKNVPIVLVENKACKTKNRNFSLSENDRLMICEISGAAAFVKVDLSDEKSKENLYDVIVKYGNYRPKTWWSEDNERNKECVII